MSVHELGNNDVNNWAAPALTKVTELCLCIKTNDSNKSYSANIIYHFCHGNDID